MLLLLPSSSKRLNYQGWDFEVKENTLGLGLILETYLTPEERNNISLPLRCTTDISAEQKYYCGN